jgi:hypothetical protein
MMKRAVQQQEATMTESLKVVGEQGTATEPEIIEGGTATAKSGLLASVAVPDHIDIESLTLEGDVTYAIAVEKVFDRIPIRKPSKQDWFRIHPDPLLTWNAVVIELKEDNEYYIIPKQLRQALFGEWVPVTLYVGINRAGVVFLWPVRLPGDDGKDMDCWISAREAAELAKKQWCRITWNRSMRAYDKRLVNNIPDPEWPELDRRKVLEIAFKGKIISSLEHPVVKMLMGQQ